MIKNVNLMQNPQDIIFDKNSEYSKEYLIQALANLGQRIGIKGDGISYKSFNFNDILLDEKLYSTDQYIGYIEYIKDDYNNQIKALFGVADKLNLEISKTVEESININNTLNFNSELSFSIPINGIEKYAKNSICINNNNELTFMLAGKKFGYNDNDANNTILMYYKFNILSNKLICGYKLFHYQTASNGENYYCLLNVNNKNVNRYELNVHIFNSALLVNDTTKDIYKIEFEKLFNYNEYSSTSLLPFSIINEDYEDLKNLLSYNETNLDFNSAISIILNLPDASVYHSKSIEVVFDVQKNELLSEEDSDDFKNFYNFYYGEYQLNLHEEIFNINEDINKLYINIFNYYNEKFYLEKRATLIKRILIKIYEKSIDYKTILGKRLYIPLDYEFHYICNSNNELNIYYSNNIYITYTSLSNVELNEFWKLNNNLIFDYEELNKLKVYNFEINYNTHIDNLINSITIKDVYTMPYINAANNWCINDSDTKIKAVGKDAGNPNIIVIYNNDNLNNSSSYTLLNVVSNKEKILTADYEQKWFNVHPALFDNLYDITIRCCAYIPKIDNINYEYFKDSIILSISDLNCLEVESFKYQYKGSYILTLWHIVEDEDILRFECINQVNSNFGLALGSTVNLLNELSDTSIANLNSQDLILLKSIISNLGHERLQVNNNNWLVIKNKQSEEYVNESSNKLKIDYNNDLNMILQYDDNISIQNNHIIHSHTNSRYLSDFNNVSITNSLYPKYEISSEEIEVKKENMSVVVQKLSTAAIRNSSVIVNGKKITNIESLIEKLKLKNEIETIEIENEIKKIETNVLGEIKTNYYEYIFNNNVPTLDFKEVFNRNFNLLNRLNIVSIDNNGTLYNGYIGTSYNESDKSTLHIGSTNTNINIGSNTLINELDRDKFNIHDTLSLDFDNIKLNAGKSINLTKEINYKYTVNNTNFNVSEFKLLDTIGIIISESNGLYKVQTYTDSLFARLNDSIYCLCVNTLMKKINKDISSYDNINISCKEYDVIGPIEYKINSNNSINTYYIKLQNESFFNLEINNVDVLYSSKFVEIMYYETSYIDINTQKTFNNINIFLSFK